MVLGFAKDEHRGRVPGLGGCDVKEKTADDGGINQLRRSRKQHQKNNQRK